MKLNSTRFFLLVAGIVVVFGCALFYVYAQSKAGEVVPDAEATLRAVPTATIQVDLSAVALYQIGQEVVVFGGSYGALVPLYCGADSRNFCSQVPTGEHVEILSIGGVEGDIWYEIDGNSGKGWLREANLQLPE